MVLVDMVDIVAKVAKVKEQKNVYIDFINKYEFKIQKINYYWLVLLC